MRVNRIGEYPVSSAGPKSTPNTADLIALALDHRFQAERSTCPTEQLELHRVADIYEVLATFDVPMAVLTEIAGRSEANPRQLSEDVERRHDRGESIIARAIRRSEASNPWTKRS